MFWKIAIGIGNLLESTISQTSRLSEVVLLHAGFISCGSCYYRPWEFQLS